jgi:DNA-binding IclR family transcriptional regulator
MKNHQPPALAAKTEYRQRGVGAVEVAATILASLQQAPAPLGVAAIAQDCGFAPSLVHHYLVSLVRTGLASTEGRPARYCLGPFAIRLGLTAVDRIEAQHSSAIFLHQLSFETGEASFFSVWSTQGPVIVRWEQGRRPLTVHARLGIAMPLLHSATGQVFLAWRPPSEGVEAMEKALREIPPSRRSAERQLVLQLVDEARRCGFGTTCGAMLPDVGALSAPVFARDEQLAGALTVLGLLKSFDATPSGPTAAALRRSAAKFSARLGYQGLFYDE